MPMGTYYVCYNIIEENEDVSGNDNQFYVRSIYGREQQIEVDKSFVLLNFQQSI